MFWESVTAYSDIQIDLGAGDVDGMFCQCGVLRSKLVSRGEARNYQVCFSGVSVSSFSKENIENQNEDKPRLKFKIIFVCF